jgi:hypothetical protein
MPARSVPAKLADLAVLSGDYLTVPVGEDWEYSLRPHHGGRVGDP